MTEAVNILKFRRSDFFGYYHYYVHRNFGRTFYCAKKIETLESTNFFFCTLLLIFSMGVMLGQRENFLKDLISLGMVSFLFFLIPVSLSILSVYILTKRFMEKKEVSEQ